MSETTREYIETNREVFIGFALYFHCCISEAPATAPDRGFQWRVARIVAVIEGVLGRSRLSCEILPSLTPS
jgi:hypothetical protein